MKKKFFIVFTIFNFFFFVSKLLTAAPLCSKSEEIKLTNETPEQTDTNNANKNNENEENKSEEEIEDEKEIEISADKKIEVEKLALEQKVEEKIIELQQEKLKTEKIRKKIEEEREIVNQGSIQAQGEAMEITLEEWLKKEFPEDYTLIIRDSRIRCQVPKCKKIVLIPYHLYDIKIKDINKEVALSILGNDSKEV